MQADQYVHYDAVILAGGRGTRLGGVDKAAVTLQGAPLLHASLRAAREARRVVLAGSTAVPTADHVIRTQEEPAGGGPAAAFVAGLLVLPDPAPHVLLLSCDVPGAAEAVRRLVAAAPEHPGRDGVVLTDPTGRPQWMLGLYRTDALMSVVDASSDWDGTPIRALLGTLDLVPVPPVGNEWHDVDTWRDHEGWTRHLRDK